MAAYVDRVDALGMAAAARLRPDDLTVLRQDGLLDPDLVLPPNATAPGVDGLARIVLQQWASVGVSRDQAANPRFRRGVAGFHCQAYAEAHPAACVDGDENPIAHWVRAGRPGGPWARRVLAPLEQPRAADGVRVALHAHFHYPELARDLQRRLIANATRCDLFLTATAPAHEAELRRVFGAWRGLVDVWLVPNRGRDVGAFIDCLERVRADGYDVLGHVHGKRSAATDLAMGDRWRDFLWDNLVGPEPMLDTAAAAFAATPRLGLLMAEDPHLVGWDGNRDAAERLRERMGLAAPLPTFFDFPLGTMFWARPNALAPLLRLGLGWADFPEEPLAYDGTILHALERLLPAVAGATGHEVAGLRVPRTCW